jgi:hypothetical protein
MRVIVEQLVERWLTGETEVLGENLPQRHFVHNKSHMTRPELEPGPPLASHRLSYGAATPCTDADNQSTKQAIVWVLSQGCSTFRISTLFLHSLLADKIN